MFSSIEFLDSLKPIPTILFGADIGPRGPFSS